MTLNPFEFTGGVFLAFYACTIGCALAALAAFRRLAVASPIDPGRPLPSLDPFEAAVLAGGSERLALVAITSLIDRGYATFAGEQLRYSGNVVEASLHPAERVVLSLEPATVARAAKRLEPYAASIEASLAAEQLMPGREAAQPYVLAVGAAILLTVALGVTKVIVGLNRGRPVEFLLLLIVLAIAAFVLMLKRRLPRTTRGELVLSQLHAARPRFGSGGNSVFADAAMRIALSGLPAMSGRNDYSRFRKSMADSSGGTPFFVSTSCSGGSSSGGSSSSCGGSSGCGGCGGGD